MRRALVACLACLALAGFTAAETATERAGRALRERPVYVAPDAEVTLSKAERRSLRLFIEHVEAPVHIAVLPERAIGEAGGIEALPRAVYEATGQPGAYGVIAGRNFRAAASSDAGLSPGEAGDLATKAFQDEHPARNGGRVAPMLDTWVALVAAAMKDPNPVSYDDETTFSDDVPVGVAPGFGLNPRNVYVQHDTEAPPGFGLATIGIILVSIVGVLSGVARSVTHSPPVGGVFDDGPAPPSFGFGSSSGPSFDDDHDSGGGSWGSSSSGSGGGSSFDDDRNSGGGSW